MNSVVSKRFSHRAGALLVTTNIFFLWLSTEWTIVLFHSWSTTFFHQHYGESSFPNIHSWTFDKFVPGGVRHQFCAEAGVIHRHWSSMSEFIRSSEWSWSNWRKPIIFSRKCTQSVEGEKRIYTKKHNRPSKTKTVSLLLFAEQHIFMVRYNNGILFLFAQSDTNEDRLVYAQEKKSFSISQPCHPRRNGKKITNLSRHCRTSSLRNGLNGAIPEQSSPPVESLQLRRKKLKSD